MTQHEISVEWDDGHEYTLLFNWSRPMPATHWDPPCGGLEEEGFDRDGEPVDEADVPPAVASYLREQMWSWENSLRSET